MGCRSGGVEQAYLPLSWEVTVTGRDAKEETIVALKGIGTWEDGDVRGLGRGVHLGQNLIREGLLDLIDVDRDAGLLSALFLRVGQLLDVAVHGVLESRSVSICCCTSITDVLSSRRR